MQVSACRTKIAMPCWRIIEIGNVSMTYRARYQRHPELLPVFDLVVLDELNPHSICFLLAALGNHLQQVGARLGFKPVNDPGSLLQALRGFDLAEFEDLRTPQDEPLAALLAACERCAYGLSDELTHRFCIQRRSPANERGGMSPRLRHYGQHYTPPVSARCVSHHTALDAAVLYTNRSKT